MSDKPITDMTPAEINAEIVRRAWGYVYNLKIFRKAHGYSRLPSESLDTCIAAMEAGGVSERSIIWAFYNAVGGALSVADINKSVAAQTLAKLRSAKAVPHD